jgi:3-hydroxybutyryl-CoA dehydrogenase
VATSWKKVGVVGCGLMGSGIVEVCARAGMDVVVREENATFLEKGLARVKKSMDTGVERKKMAPEERDAAWGRVKGTTEFAPFADCDVVIEAITENLDAKKAVFTALDKVVKAGALFASNTSSISITEMAACTSRPERFVGLHFFNPPPVMKLLEIVVGVKTSPETLAEARAFGEKCGKVTVTAKDTPGFIVNYLLVPYLNAAVKLLASGVASRDDIDTAVKLGLGHPMGPIELLDYVGIDTTVFIGDVLFDAFKQPEMAAPPAMRNMMNAGLNGRKSGKGFYDWSSGKAK